MDVMSFGKTKSKEEVYLYTLTNAQGAKLTVMNYGATVVSLLVPDRRGKLRDVVLGYDTVEEYETNTYYFGATIGRNANRIKDGECTIEGRRYKLEPNDQGNNLHRGSHGMHNVVWVAHYNEEEKNRITFSYVSKEEEQGFPGNLTIKVIYTLTDHNEVVIHYEGRTDKTTIANFTNHTYFNLNGHAHGSVEEHYLMIHAAAYTPVIDEKAIPTGRIESVKGTPMDFSSEKQIGRDIADEFTQLRFGGGYDHNYVLDKSVEPMCLAARARAEESGIVMEVYTDCLGLQFYSGNFIKNHRGKAGSEYHFRQGFCLETQYYPNAINESEFTSPILRPGDVYESETRLCFKAIRATH